VTETCAGTGHLPVTARQQNHGLAHGMITVTWCLICGRRLPRQEGC